MAGPLNGGFQITDDDAPQPAAASAQGGFQITDDDAQPDQSPGVLARLKAATVGPDTFLGRTAQNVGSLFTPEGRQKWVESARGPAGGLQEGQIGRASC